MIRILVTGVGAIIGYGIVNALRKIDEKVHIVGTDIYKDAVGQTWVDKFVQAPFTSSEEYSSWLRQILKNDEVDLIIPGFEQDVHFFSDNPRILDGSSAKIAINNKVLINTSRDKWLTYEALSKLGSTLAIDSALFGEFDDLVSKFGLPFLLKPRQSYAGKGISVVNSIADFNARRERLGEELMAQRLVGDDDQEYTVGMFGDGKGGVSALIAFRRLLAIDGSTAKATVVENEEIKQHISELAKYFKPNGPTNFQFRGHEGALKLLEINPRISSSTSLRVAFGYNEAEMCIDYFLKRENIIQPEIIPGSASRYIADWISYARNHF